MSFQAIRNYFEKPVREGVARVSAAIPVLTENQSYVDNDAAAEFVLVRLNFGSVTEPTLCEPMERIRGALIVEIYTAKGQGPGRGQRLATEVMILLNALEPPIGNTKVRGKVLVVNGPTFTPLDGRPHLLTRLSCSVLASYT